MMGKLEEASSTQEALQRQIDQRSAREDLATFIIELSQDLARLADQGGWHIAAENLRCASVEIRQRIEAPLADEPRS